MPWYASVWLTLRYATLVHHLGRCSSMYWSPMNTSILYGVPVLTHVVRVLTSTYVPSRWYVYEYCAMIPSVVQCSSVDLCHGMHQCG